MFKQTLPLFILTLSLVLYFIAILSFSVSESMMSFFLLASIGSMLFGLHQFSFGRAIAKLGDGHADRGSILGTLVRASPRASLYAALYTFGVVGISLLIL